MDTDAAASDLVAVEHEIVGPCAHLGRCVFQFVEILGHGRGKRVMGRHQLSVVAAFEQWELGDPGELPLVLRDQVELVGDMQAQAAEHGVDQLARSELQEEKIALLQTRCCVQVLAHGLAHGLHGRAGPDPACADARAGQTAGAQALDEFFQLVHFRIRHLGRLGGRQAPGLDHAGLRSAGSDRLLQHIHVAAVVFADDIGDVAQGQSEAQVRFV